MQTRREALKKGLAAAGVAGGGGLLAAGLAHAFNKSAFQATSVQDAVKALGGSGSLAESRDVTLQGPEIAENGAVVPLAGASTLPGLKLLAFMVEKNPNTLSAAFHVSDAVEANFSTRVKMAETSQVYAVAIAADGKAFYAKKEIKVTLGGCGG